MGYDDFVMKGKGKGRPMRTVYLMRHAKSSWDNAAFSDHDRPLNGRGRDACARLAAYMAAHAIAPDHILCSGAARTVETLERVRPALAGEPTVDIDDGLYLASAETVVARLRRLDDRDASALVIAHHPGIAQCALLLAGADRTGERDRIRAKYPTGALACLAFDIPTWADIGPGRGRITLFVAPRDLPAI